MAYPGLINSTFFNAFIACSASICIVSGILVENPLRYDLTCYTADMFKTPNQYEDVVDMEAYALAKICYRNNISFISFKYITDEGNGNDWEKNCGKGISKFKEVLKEYVE